MKKIIFTLALILASLVALQAQELHTQQDTIATFKVENGDDVVLSSEGKGLSINIAGYNISLANPKEEHVKWQLYGYCVAKVGFAWLTEPNYNLYESSEQDFLNLDGMRSHYFSLPMLTIRHQPRANSKLTFLTGLDYSHYAFYFEGNNTLRYSDGLIRPSDTELSLSVNSMALGYITVPLGVELKLADKFYVKAGGHIGAMVAPTIRYLSGTTETREYSRDGFNTFSAGLNLGVEYCGFEIFCNYTCTDIFQSSHGPKTQPFSIGISILNFAR